MKKLSIFVDESGDFGLYTHHSPYYIVTLVFHDQSVDISKNIACLNDRVNQSGLPLLIKYLDRFIQYERIVVYYDFGQMQLTKILVSVFSAILSNVEFRKVSPANYKLFQAADMLCTLELLSTKAKTKMLSKSERLFFTSERSLTKSYLRAIYLKRWSST